MIYKHDKSLIVTQLFLIDVFPVWGVRKVVLPERQS
jgi:hypothetical protein